MIGKYLGEEAVDISRTMYSTYEKIDWIRLWVEMYGWIDGDHHKAWLLDQISRIIHDSKVIVSLAKWDNGHEEYRFNLDEPPETYLDWVKSMKNGEDGPNTYSYNYGIAP